MKLITLIIAVIFSTVVSAQNSTPLNVKDKEIKQVKVDSMDLKVISMRDLDSYLERINAVTKKQLTIDQQAQYAAIFKELQLIYQEADKKRKQK